MTRQNFQNRFEDELKKLIPITAEYVLNRLPSFFKFIVVTNAGERYGPLSEKEEGYKTVIIENIDENSKINPCEFDTVVDLLWQSDEVPFWIEVHAHSCDDNYTYVQLTCSSIFHHSDFLHSGEKNAPFRTYGPFIPKDCLDGASGEITKFDLNHKLK